MMWAGITTIVVWIVCGIVSITLKSTDPLPIAFVATIFIGIGAGIMYILKY